jgi:hypothetical protein
MCSGNEKLENPEKGTIQKDAPSFNVALYAKAIASDLSSFLS